MCSTLSLALQIAFTPLFMFVFGLGLAGAPLATLTGQAIGLIPRSRFIFGANSPIRPRLIPRVLHPRHFTEILRVGVPASLSAALNYDVDDPHGDHRPLRRHVPRRVRARLAARLLLFSLGFGVAAAGLTLVGMAVGAGRPSWCGATSPRPRSSPPPSSRSRRSS
jgi:Na+-driven multidrug efflux pump